MRRPGDVNRSILQEQPRTLSFTQGIKAHRGPAVAAAAHARLNFDGAAKLLCPGRDVERMQALYGNAALFGLSQYIHRVAGNVDRRRARNSNLGD
jgi:hypothetical protein